MVTCYLCPSQLNESEDPDINRVIELSSGGTRHIGYYDLKRIYLSAVELLAKELDEFLKW